MNSTNVEDSNVCVLVCPTSRWLIVNLFIDALNNKAEHRTIWSLYEGLKALLGKFLIHVPSERPLAGLTAKFAKGRLKDPSQYLEGRGMVQDAD